MSHCCGEDPEKKKPEASEKDIKNENKQESAENKSTGAATGAWQPAEK
jgi:hypothetical protein